MYEISVPIMNSHIKRSNRDRLLEELREQLNNLKANLAKM